MLNIQLLTDLVTVLDTTTRSVTRYIRDSENVHVRVVEHIYE
jgi:hypothetical protein